MSVRFVIGRAGTGKTHHCIESIRSRLRHDPVQGPRLILLVPEQAGLQMERAIIDPAGGCGGAHRADVVSFQRLAVRVLSDANATTRAALTESARAMVLRHLLAANWDKLTYYGRAARLGRKTEHLAGLIDRVGKSVSELIEEAVEPAELRALVDAMRPATDPAQVAKLHDLVLLYELYLDYLGEDWLDPACRLELARTQLGACGWVRGAEIWVDGFASFSGQERGMLLAMAHLAAHVDITLLTDPQSALDAAGSHPDKVHLFAKTTRTHAELHRAMVDAGLSIETPLIMAPPVPPRFSEPSLLGSLERNVFSAGPVTVPASSGADGTFLLVELPSRRIEVDYAVSCVSAWVQGQGGEASYRYRDIAIIVRDLELYHDLLAEALRGREIPCFIDRRRPVTHHPLVELLRSLVGAGVEGLSLSTMRQLIQCGMMPQDAEALDELENYLIEHGIEGADRWREPEWRHRRMAPANDRDKAPSEHAESRPERVAATRKAIWRWLAPWIEVACVPEAPTGAGWQRAVASTFTVLKVSMQLARWAGEAEARGDLDLAEEHREVWKQVSSLLDDLAFVFADRRLSIVELQEVVEAGLSQLTLGLVPPMIDQILVGSVDRSRHPDIKAAILIGLNDGVFPQPISEDSILNDDDRQRLIDGGIGVGLPSRCRVLDESMLAYIALTRPSERMVVTWAVADETGAALRPSPYVRAIEEALPGIARTQIGEPARCRLMWDVLASRDVTRRVAMEFRTRAGADEDDKRIRARWNELYAANRVSWSASAMDRRILSSLADSEHAISLTPELVARYCGQTLKASVSSLEAYATCPFKFFTTYMLRLKERQERALAPVDIGQVHHAVLEDFINGVAQGGGDLGALEDSELVDALGASCGRVGQAFTGSDFLSNARDAYVLSRSASQLAGVVRAQRGAAAGGRTKAKETELAFGFERAGALPALTIRSAKGRLAELRGFIDRVDLAELGDEYLGIVIDYKRTRHKRLDLSRVYHGLSLQLLAYLLVLAECGKSLTGRTIRPGGALFVSLSPDYTPVVHPDSVSEREAASPKSSRPRGLLSEEAIGVLDTSGKTSWLDHYQVFRKKNGELGSIDASDASDDPSFIATLELVRRRMGEFVDRVLDGDVSVRPYRLGTVSPCSWCSMQAACRFELGTCDTELLQTLKRTEVFDRLGGRATDASGDGVEKYVDGAAGGSR